MMKETNNTNSTEETTRNTNAIVRCPCETEEEFDALGWVQCDGCDVWQHAFCAGFDVVNEISLAYFCEKCEPNGSRKRPTPLEAMRFVAKLVREEAVRQKKFQRCKRSLTSSPPRKLAKTSVTKTSTTERNRKSLVSSEKQSKPTTKVRRKQCINTDSAKGISTNSEMNITSELKQTSQTSISAKIREEVRDAQSELEKMHKVHEILSRAPGMKHRTMIPSDDISSGKPEPIISPKKEIEVTQALDVRKMQFQHLTESTPEKNSERERELLSQDINANNDSLKTPTVVKGPPIVRSPVRIVNSVKKEPKVEEEETNDESPRVFQKQFTPTIKKEPKTEEDETNEEPPRACQKEFTPTVKEEPPDDFQDEMKPQKEEQRIIGIEEYKRIRGTLNNPPPSPEKIVTNWFPSLNNIPIEMESFSNLQLPPTDIAKAEEELNRYVFGDYSTGNSPKSSTDDSSTPSHSTPRLGSHGVDRSIFRSTSEANLAGDLGRSIYGTGISGTTSLACFSPRAPALLQTSMCPSSHFARYSGYQPTTNPHQSLSERLHEIFQREKPSDS